MEALLRDEIVRHLENNRLIHESQHGMNILAFLDKVTDVVDKGSVDVVFLDLAKAFDKVPHKRMLIKLKDHRSWYRWTGKVLQWIENWLKGRKQRAHVKALASNWLPVTSGVPQGSGLGPVLFLIYVNDMNSDLHSWIIKFADDTKIFNGVKDESDCAMLQ